MSSKETANSGYTLEVTELLKAVPTEHHSEFNSLLEDSNKEGMLEFFEKHLPENFPQPDEIFDLSNEDTSDDLENGKFYAIFSESDLFITQPSPALLALREKTLDPTKSAWVTWN